MVGGGRGGSRLLRGILLLASFTAFGCSGNEAKRAPGPGVPDPSASTPLDAATVAAFEAKIDAARSGLDVPGVAVALVKDGQFALLEGYGVRDIATSAPVTPDTVFRVGSITKSFTSTLVAALADDGVLTFDTRAKDIDPTFELSTPALTEEMTLRKLFSMGTGLAEPDGFFWDYPHAADLLATLPTLGNAVPEGTYFYNNEVYASGAYLALEAAAPPDGLDFAYGRLVGERILTPAGMSPAAVSDDPSTVSDDFSNSYLLTLVDAPESPELSGFTPLGSVGPSGSLATSVTGLAKYALLHLGHGVAADGTRVVSAANLAETYVPQTPLHFDGLPWLDHYAAGWVSGKEQGFSTLWHDGGIDAYYSCLLLVPEDDLALAVLTNGSNGQALCLYLDDLLFELVYGATDLDSNSILASWNDSRVELAALASALAREEPIDAGSVAPFLGDYSHRISVELDDAGALWVVSPGTRSRVVRADKLFGKAGAYLVASGPEVGFELTFTPTALGQKLTIVDPSSGDTVLVLAR
jgi:beta-lactamase class C